MFKVVSGFLPKYKKSKLTVFADKCLTSIRETPILLGMTRIKPIRTTVKKTYPQIYKLQYPHRVYHEISLRSVKLGLTKRKFCETEKEAREFVKKFESDMRANGSDSMSKNLVVTDSVISEYESRLNIFGKTLKDAVNHYVNFLAEKAITDSIPTIEKLAEDWKNDKVNSKNNPLSARTEADIKSYSKWIKRVLGKYRTAEVTKKICEDALGTLTVGKVSRNHYRRHMSMFFIWCQSHDLATNNPVEFIKLGSEQKEIEIYEPEQIQQILNLAQTEKFKKLLGFYIAETFLGLRPTEAARVEWKHLNFTTKEIYVTKGKTPARRFKMNETAIQWLKFFKTISPNEFNPKIAHSNLQKEFRSSFQFDWIADGLRHTYGTNRWNEIKNIQEVSFEMGNSIPIAKRHYCREVEQAKLKVFWSLTPPFIGLAA